MLKIKRDWVKAGVKIVANAGVGYVVKETINNFVPQETPKQKILAFIGRVAITGVILAPVEERIDLTIDGLAEAIINAKNQANPTS
jgi:hypothetical protein